MESYDFTVFDFKSITWNNSKAMVNKQTTLLHFALKKQLFTVITHKKRANHGKNIIVLIGVTHSQCPVDTQVQRDENKVVRK